MPIRTNWLMLGHQKQDQGAKEGHPVRDDQGEEWIDLAGHAPRRNVVKRVGNYRHDDR